MKRTIEVINGYNLRITQMLSALVFLKNKNFKGRLVQIQTGEGKTNIVSLLAAIKVFQGKKVDVITSNEVLATEGVDSEKDFFGALGISVATNNPDDSYKSSSRGCYKADVVYGNIGNFQFDYLRDYSEGLGTRAGREFSVVILDEVDSMLLDNGGHIAKLAAPFPGMDILKYIYIKIWEELHVAEEKIVNESLRDLEMRIKEFPKNSTLSGEEFQFAMREYVAKQLENSTDRIAEKIKSTHPENIEMIPPHLQDYAKSMLDRWIHNALYAKYSCTENREYVIRKVKGEDFIIPIDYQNTGVTMRNTIWSDGLHQFVQLKHNLQITTETLTSSFISNFGYIKFYKNIFGMTGTLGSIAEQNLLSSVYDVDFAKVSTFKPKKFEELDGIVVHDDDWLNLVSMEAVYMTQQGRPVLIICKTIDDLRNIEKSIRELQEDEEIADLNIRNYIDEDHSGVVKGRLNETEIVLATNIGGRGTDFKITDKVKENGGLHVIISFLPSNKRVEDQALGRTARKGEPGTGQLIISESEIISLDIIISNETTFDTIKMERDKAEARRLEFIKNVEVEKINLQDIMFGKFAFLYRRFSKKKFTSLKHKYLAMDLKESWAFWLHMKNYNKANITGLKVETEFQRFRRHSYKILGPLKHGEYTGGDITHNPYYSIRYAESLLKKDKNKDAKTELEHAISLSAANPNLLYSAYLKLFEVEIELGNQIWTRLGKALAKTAIVGYFLEEEDYSEYKQRAKTNLIKANNSLTIEINYINDTFLGKDSTKFSNILTVEPEDNLLLNHLNSRLYVLSVFQNHIGSLLSEIEKSGDNGMVMGTRIPDYLKTLGKDDPGSEEAKIRKAIKDAELDDFSMVGLDTIYKLETVNDPSDEVIASAQGQIAAGLALIGAGTVFPIVAPVSVSVGVTLITEGIIDVLMEILDFYGKSTFNLVDYIKGKAISYGISLATFGVGKILQTQKVVNWAIKASKGLSKILRKCPVLKKVFAKLAMYVDDFTIYLQKFLEGANKGSKILKSLKEMTKAQFFKSQLASIGKTSLTRVIQMQIYQRVVIKIVNGAMQDLKPDIEEAVKKVLEERNMRQQLESLQTEKVRTLTVDIIKGRTDGEIATEVFEEIGIGVLKNANFQDKNFNLFVQTSIDISQKMSKFNDYAEKFCKKFEERSSMAATSNKTLANVDASLTFITAQLTGKMYGICTGLVGKNIQKLVVSPAVKKVFEEKKYTKLPEPKFAAYFRNPKNKFLRKLSLCEKKIDTSALKMVLVRGSSI
jgi:hypothetical protein